MQAQVSNYFRGNPICNTKPSFGIVASLNPNNVALKIRDKFINSARLVLSSPDTSMHVTLFQANLELDKSCYQPASLPTDLLASLLNGTMEKTRNLEVGDFYVTGKLLVLGRDCPSHLALEVLPQNPDAVITFRRAAMTALKEEMKSVAQKMVENQLSYDDSVPALSGPGWRVTARGFLERPDYRMHVTLGVLASGNEAIDSNSALLCTITTLTPPLYMVIIRAQKIDHRV